MEPTNRKLLVVDDNRAIHEDFRKILMPATPEDDELAALEAELFGESMRPPPPLTFEVHSAYQGEDGVLAIREALASGHPFAMAFVDVRMPPGIDGVVAAERMLALDPDLQIVICSAHSDHRWADIREAFGDDAARALILRKPFETIEVRQLAFSLTEKCDLSRRAFSRLQELDAAVAARTSELRDANEALLRQMEEGKRMEAELRLAHKLEAVGQLAAGVAHEINTPIQYVGDNLTFIKSSIESIVSALEQCLPVIQAASTAGNAAATRALQHALAMDVVFIGEQLPGALTESFDGVRRVSEIVRAMKEFAYPHQGEAAEADINQALQNTVTVSRNEHKLVANVEMDLGDIPPVTCSLGDLNQVFLNLVVNAAHAIGEANAETGQIGTICITTRREGSDVVVGIADTGTGIPETIRARIFDPFFTTKDVGKGTGQGLAIAHRIIVDKHGGSLALDSEVGRGTTFRIRLPIAGTGRAA